MADNYFIFRSGKLKTHQDVTNVLKEQHRADDYESHRADKTQSYKNEYSAKYQNAIQTFDELLPKKRRKNAVVGLNFVVSTSQEFSSKAEESAFYGQAINYISQNFGRVVGWAIHRDETSPHLQVVTIPLVDGKLNARQLIGGDKHRMKRIQTDFYETVGKEFGLKRGKDVAETKAVHKTVEQKHREREKSLSDADRSLSEREKELSRQESSLNEKEAQINAKGAIISDYMKHAKENSLEVLQECEQTKKNKFHTPWDLPKFMQKVYESVSGAWALVKKLTDKNQQLEKKLENWRNSSADELEKLAADYRAVGVDSWKEFETKQQKKRHYNGFSMSD